MSSAHCWCNITVPGVRASGARDPVVSVHRLPSVSSRLPAFASKPAAILGRSTLRLHLYKDSARVVA